MNVGKLTRVPLRDVWKHEATGFTHWLEDNIDVPNDVIGVNFPGSNRKKVQDLTDLGLDVEDAMVPRISSAFVWPRLDLRWPQRCELSPTLVNTLIAVWKLGSSPVSRILLRSLKLAIPQRTEGRITSRAAPLFSGSGRG